MPITISPAHTEERKNLDLRAGDTVRVLQKIIERTVEKDKVKEKSRLQAFEGLILARKHGAEAGGTFTVRRVIDGVGVERIFPLFAPTIDKIEILKRAKVRRAKLYHIRKKATKEIKRAMRHERIQKKETPVIEVPKAEEAKA
ncbi:MAG: 50S ribosomal protein L19 [Patescibacteria group bacterium]